MVSTTLTVPEGENRSLGIYNSITDPIAAMTTIGKAIARSKMFGCDNEDQGMMLALECLARQLPPMKMAETYHLIQGKLSMKYDAMLAQFNRAGGVHRVLSRTPDLCEIELTWKGDTQRFGLSWEDCQKEPFVYSNTKKPEGGYYLKDNYSTPRRRMQMMWARVVSDGVRTMAPIVVQGYYTPEELETDMGDSPRTVEVQVREVVVNDPPVAVKPAAKAKKTVAKEADPVDPPTMAVSVATVVEPPAPLLVEPVATAAPAIPVETAEDVPFEFKDTETAAKLASMSTQKPTGQVGPAAKQMNTTDRLTKAQDEQIRNGLKDLNGKRPGTVASFKQALVATGRSAISDFTTAQADQLLAAIARDQIAAFFESLPAFEDITTTEGDASGK